MTGLAVSDDRSVTWLLITQFLVDPHYVAFTVQANLNYPYLDYLDFSIIRTFSPVPILSWIFISHDQDLQQYSI